MAYSAPRTWTTGELVTAAYMNAIRDTLLESAPAKVTTAGDMLVATGANALARLAKGTDGQELTMVAGAVAWATPAAGVIANTSAESVLGSDVNMSASATWTDIGPSLSLAAGEWLVMAHVTFLSTSPTGNADARIYDSTGAVELASGSEYVESSRYRTIAMVARVVLGGTSTVKLQYFVVTGSASWNVDSGGSAGTKATKLVAVRVA